MWKLWKAGVLSQGEGMTKMASVPALVVGNKAVFCTPIENIIHLYF